MATLSAQESMGTIDKFIQDVGAAEKTASDRTKRAEALSEPGSQGGSTTHPVKDVDDRLEVATEGERSAENDSDIKEDQGKPGVNSAAEAKAAADGSGGAVQTSGSAADDHLQIGTNTQATGDDPSVETNSAKKGKEDPGSSHPARTDNENLDGHKYSSDQLANMDLRQLAKVAADFGNDLCAVLAVEADPYAKSTYTQKQAGDSELSHQAGWELAGLFSGDFDKAAADDMVQDTLEETIKVAAEDADRVISFLNSYQDGIQKHAMGEEGGMGMPGMEEMPPTPPGGGMPMGGGGGEEDMMSALGGGDPAAGDPMGGGMGGGEEDMMSALGGGEEEMGDEGGEEVAQLAEALDSLGISVEELEAAMASQDGGGAPGGDMGGEMGGEDMGGMPDEGMEGGLEVEAGDRWRRQQRGGHRKTAAVKRGEAKNAVRDYIQEVISRSRNAR